MNTFVLDYAKVSPVTILDVVNRHFDGRAFARWIDFDHDTFGIRIVAVGGTLSDDDAKWVTDYLNPFLFDYEKDFA